jgi:hypothetical protein
MALSKIAILIATVCVEIAIFLGTCRIGREIPDFPPEISRAGMALKFISQMSDVKVRLKKVPFRRHFAQRHFWVHPSVTDESDGRTM